MNRKRVVAYIPTRTKKAQSLYDFFAARGKDGIYQNNLRCAFHRFRREPTWINLKVFGVHLSRLMLGDRLMNAVLSDRATVITGEYCCTEENECLYHFAPSDCIGSIRSSGLLPKDRFVYLTDAPEYCAQIFLPWKTQQIRATTAYTLLSVDTQQLLKEQKIYCTDRDHEFVTGRIRAKYISAVPDDQTELS